VGEDSHVDDPYVEEITARAAQAAAEWAGFDQARTDRVAEAVARAALAAGADLARLAADETGIGVLEDKVWKNEWAARKVWEDIRNRVTVGEISRDDGAGVTEIARPRGPILAMTPLTNPTSTVIFKCLIAAKTRNPVIFSPHRAARKCSREAARICYEAAREAGAPEHAFQWITRSRKEVVEGVMRHRRTALILATGTADVVTWAQQSGNPVIGVGPGNVPVYVHSDADPEAAAAGILLSKTFDNGTVCASEQALIVTREVDAAVRPALAAAGAHFCTAEEAAKLGAVAVDAERGGMSPAVVGRAPAAIAEAAGFAVPAGTRLLVAEPAGIGREHPLSLEILAPILACYVVDDLDAAVAAAAAVSRLGGIGHTVGVWTEDEAVVRRFTEEVPAGRVLINQPTTQGAIGGAFNRLPASLTLGTGRGNLTADNVTVDHLLVRQRVARRTA
jgi:acetaldehyde dehydrogenase/alcohol dehydrogenase